MEDVGQLLGTPYAGQAPQAEAGLTATWREVLLVMEEGRGVGDGGGKGGGQDRVEVESMEKRWRWNGERKGGEGRRELGWNEGR